MGTLYYGDNLDILTRYVADASADLVYLDPPFHSAQNYNAFFQEKDGSAAAAQIAPPSPAAVSLHSAQAFEDTWETQYAAHIAFNNERQRNSESQCAYEELSLRGDKFGSVMRAFMEYLGVNGHGSDMMACLAMMARASSNSAAPPSPPAHCN